MTLFAKTSQLQGASPPDPHQGLHLWTPLGALPPGPRYRLALHALAICPRSLSPPVFGAKLRPWSGVRGLNELAAEFRRYGNDSDNRAVNAERLRDSTDRLSAYQWSAGGYIQQSASSLPKNGGGGKKLSHLFSFSTTSTLNGEDLLNETRDRHSGKGV